MTGRPANAIATSDVPLAGNISHYSAEQAAIACRISKVRRASISETKEARPAGYAIGSGSGDGQI